MSSSEPRARRFLLLALGLAALMWGTLGLLARLSDPLGLFEDRGGICAPGAHVDTSEAYAPFLADHRAAGDVLLGSSRTLRGFDAAAFAPDTAVNLGVSSASLHETVALGRRALRGGKVRRLWIGLDYLTLRQRSPSTRFDAGPSGLPAGLDRWLAGAFSPTAIRALGRLALHPDRCRHPVADRNGMLTAPEAGTGGPRQRRRLDADAGPAAEAARFRELAGLIADARRVGAEPILFIGPYGRGVHEALEASGQAGDYRRLRARIAGFARARRIELVETPELDNAPCAPGTACPMFDATHFAPSVGRMLVERHRGMHIGAARR